MVNAHPCRRRSDVRLPNHSFQMPEILKGLACKDEDCAMRAGCWYSVCNFTLNRLQSWEESTADCAGHMYVYTYTHYVCNRMCISNYTYSVCVCVDVHKTISIHIRTLVCIYMHTYVYTICIYVWEAVRAGGFGSVLVFLIMSLLACPEASCTASSWPDGNRVQDLWRRVWV